jgi:hypothetical protein
VPTVQVNHTVLAPLSKFKQDTQSVASFGKNQPIAQRVMDRAGWK